MSLININIHLSALVKAVERVADALEKLVLVEEPPKWDGRKAGVDKLLVLENEKLWEMEQEELRVMAKGEIPPSSPPPDEE